MDPSHEPYSDEIVDAVATRFRLLGTPSRLRVLNQLLVRPRSMSELQELCGLEQSNLSRRVAELEQAGCVRRSRRGRRVVVEVADPSLRELCQLVCGALKRRIGITRCFLSLSWGAARL